MKPHIKLAEAKTPDGGALSLFEHDGAYSISLNGQEVMHSRASTSEELLGQLGVERLNEGEASRVLIGGLGLGFTLHTALKYSGAETIVEVVELIPEVVEWNRTFMNELNGSLLDDARVEIRQENVSRLIRKAKPKSYDAIILDVDNGPVAMLAKNNFSLYSNTGLRAIREALKPKGRVVFWSAGPEPLFEPRFGRIGFKVTAVPAKIHERAKRAAYMLYVGDRLT
jgi:spermidine synthase